MIYEEQETIMVPVKMRPFTHDDITDRYRSWFHDPEITQYNSHGLFPYTRKKEAELLEDIEEGRRIVWAIDAMTPHGWVLVGNCSLQSINYHNRSAEFAIVIGDKKYWGKGIGTFALKMAIHHAFVVMGLHRVWTGTAATNLGMQHTCTKAGMHREGRFKHGMYLRGKFVDIFAYGIVRKEK